MQRVYNDISIWNLKRLIVIDIQFNIGNWDTKNDTIIYWNGVSNLVSIFRYKKWYLILEF